jgi:hypothetical protein
MVLGSGIRDPRSGIRKKPIPDPGSKGQKAPNPGSRIPDPDPQHCLDQSMTLEDSNVSYPDSIRSVDPYEGKNDAQK